MQIVWDKVSRETYDNMVSVLLSRTHPSSRRVDGAGGDEGRDVYFEGPSGESIFQLKSFTGRLSSSRKAQIRRSLKRAAQRRTERWWLVVPIDPTPSEQRWFDDLKLSVLFPIEWLGQTWLDGEFAKFPEVSEYFIQDHRDEVLRMLAELNQEGLALDSAADATERLRRLHTRLNQIDPYFRYDIGIGPSTNAAVPAGAILSVCSDDVRISVFERYPGALQDRPILAHLELKFEPDDISIDRVAEAFEYGRAVSLPASVVVRFKLDAPAVLGGDFHGATVDIGPNRVVTDVPFAVEACLERNGKQLAVLPFRCEERTVGFKGAVIDGADDSGWLAVKIIITPGERRMNVTFSLNPTSRLPSTLVPMVRWAEACAPPSILKMRIDGQFLGAMAVPDVWFPVDAGELIKMLAFLQEKTGSYFPMPLELTQADWEDVRDSFRLLRGERLESPWSSMSFEMAGYDQDQFRRLLQGEKALRFVREEWLVLDGNRIPLGEVTTALPAARVKSPRRLRAALDARQSPIRVELVPGTTDRLIKFVAEN